MNSAASLKRIARKVISSRTYLRASRTVDRAMLKLHRARAAQEKTHGAVVLATAGRGNIGDQAMLEAVLANVPGQVTVVLSGEESLRIPASTRDRVDVLNLPSLVMGAPIGRLRARRIFLSALARSERLLIIGADIMDGSYDRREAVLRLDLAQLSTAMGVPAVVLGFSWSGHPDPEAVTRARIASRSVDLLARDPRSAARLRESGVGRVRLVSDVVFSLPRQDELPTAAAAWLEQCDTSMPIAILNPSGLLAARHPQIRDDYLAIAQHMLGIGCALIILPHVLRAGDDDLAEAQRLRDQISDASNVLLIDHELAPGEVGALASRAAVVITGRMHLAILSMNNGTPAAVIGSQGKVTGLLELAGLEHLELTPDGSLTASAAAATEEMLASPALRARLAENIGRIRQLSAQNFHPSTSSQTQIPPSSSPEDAAVGN